MSKRGKANGCGPFWVPDVIPDGPDGRWKSPCDMHDDEYLEGGTLMDKHIADVKLLHRSCASLKYAGTLKRYCGYILAAVYFIFVLSFGHKSFTFKQE